MYQQPFDRPAVSVRGKKISLITLAADTVANGGSVRDCKAWFRSDLVSDRNITDLHLTGGSTLNIGADSAFAIAAPLQIFGAEDQRYLYRCSVAATLSKRGNDKGLRLLFAWGIVTSKATPVAVPDSSLALKIAEFEGYSILDTSCRPLGNELLLTHDRLIHDLAGAGSYAKTAARKIVGVGPALIIQNQSPAAEIGHLTVRISAHRIRESDHGVIAKTFG